MKTVRMFTFLLSAILLISAGYALIEEEVKTQEKSSSMEKFDDAKVMSKAQGDVN